MSKHDSAQHAPYPEKPHTQHVNEQLSAATPAGYAPHVEEVVEEAPKKTGAKK